MTPGPLAIFDLDRTMHAGSGLGVLARYAFKSRLITPDDMARSFVHDFVFRKGRSTDSHINSIAELALAMAGGTTLADLTPVLDETADDIVASVRPPMLGVLDLHRDAGHRCVLLSASPQRLVARIADGLGFDYGIGTIIEVVDDLVTGKMVPPMCYGTGKLDRLRAVIGWPGPDDGPPRANGDRPASPGAASTYAYAYADSMSDLPLLEAVESPFAVVPDRGLRKLATERGWPILEA